jgi:CBS domain-containing membrane protein
MNVLTRLFRPILPGATVWDRILCSLGALTGIAVTAVIGYLTFGRAEHLPFLVAPLGASAVLVFAVPSSPLAQPWSVIGGNTIGALVGIAASRTIGDPFVACSVAVAVAITAMSFLRCLHPPGGAAALTAVLGGPSVAAAGYKFAFFPMAANSVALVICGLLFHLLTRHRYPHRAVLPGNVHGTQDRPPLQRVGFTSQDIDAALADIGESFDIDRGDLEEVLRRVELRALARRHKNPTCGDVMSRDLVLVRREAPLVEARSLMLRHALRTLPVVDATGQLCGVISLRQLNDAKHVEEAMVPPICARPEDDAVALIPKLADGVRHAIVVVDDANRPVGMVTQTDLLACLSHVRLIDERAAAA